MHRNITAKLIKQATLKISKMGWGGTITQKGTKNQHKSVMRNNESQKVKRRDIFKMSKKSPIP